MTSASAVTTAVAVSGGVVAIVGSMFTYLSYRRGQYDSVLAETAKLTSGETAKSRHEVGFALEDPPDAGPILLKPNQMRAYFNVLWTFERLYALYVSLRPVMLRRRLSGPQRLLLQSISGSILTWSRYDERLKNSIESDDSSGGLRRLAEALDRLPDPDRPKPGQTSTGPSTPANE